MSSQLLWVVQLSLGAMFALSAVSKLENPMGFVHGVEEYKILPRRSVFVFALLVILCEGFLALSHLAGWLLVFAVPLALTMLCSFLAAVSINLVNRRDLPCFCFGGREGETISTRSVARLVVAIVGEGVLLLQPGLFVDGLTRSAPHRSTKDVVLALSWTLFVLLAIVWGLSVPTLITLARSKFHKASCNSPYS